MFYLMTATTFAVFFFGCKTAQSSNEMPTPNQTNGKASPTATPPFDEIPQTEIKSDAVSRVEFRTVYKDFYDADAKCHKDYVEYFGKEDGAASSSSPCEATLSFERNGAVTKTIVVRRWDKTARQTKEVEKYVWTAKISAEQFNQTAKIVMEDEGFKTWRDGTSLNVSNATVSVTHPKGTRSMQMNLVTETVNRLPLFGEFKRLDKELIWEKKQ